MFIDILQPVAVEGGERSGPSSARDVSGNTSFALLLAQMLRQAIGEAELSAASAAVDDGSPGGAASLWTATLLVALAGLDEPSALSADLISPADGPRNAAPVPPAGENNAAAGLAGEIPAFTAGAASGPQAPASLDALFNAVAARYGLEPSLLKAVARVESGFNPSALSPAGAQGLMQLTPATAAAMGVQNPWDAAQNLEGAARYLRQLLDRFHGSVPLALAAYNAGPGAVERYGGIPPYRETQQYVQRVSAAQREFMV